MSFDPEDDQQQRLEREEIDPRLLSRAEDTFYDAMPVEAISRQQQYSDYRKLHRPFRSAFRGGLIAGERARRIMGHVGQCNLRGLS